MAQERQDRFIEGLKKQIASLLNDTKTTPLAPTTEQDLGDQMVRQIVTAGDFEYRRVAVTRSKGKVESVGPTVVWKGGELDDATISAETKAEVRAALADLDKQVRAKDRSLLPDEIDPDVALIQQMFFDPKYAELLDAIEEKGVTTVIRPKRKVTDPKKVTLRAKV